MCFILLKQPSHTLIKYPPFQLKKKYSSFQVTWKGSFFAKNITPHHKLRVERVHNIIMIVIKLNSMIYLLKF